MRKLKKLNVAVLVLSTMIIATGCGDSNKSDSKTSESQKGSSQKESTLVRDTEFGKVKGYEKDKALIWQGIPYGGDTSGENRWQAPTDPIPWEDELDATKAAEMAMQKKADNIVGTESPLNLDIYRPDNDKEKLPVLVFIHGGNNLTGNAQETSGASFVRNHDAIVITVSYRLGVFGFNPLAALKTGTDEENSGNYTMLDLSKSLEWVRANIANFGGDSENVTVSGFSSGGRDIMAMLISPYFAGKFDKAISFSGGMTLAEEAPSQEVFAKAIAPLVVEDKLKENEQEASDWLLTSDKEVKDYLYKLDGKRLTSLISDAGIRMGVFPHLYKDGTMIPKEGFETTRYNSVPLMMLSGEQEFATFAFSDPYFIESVGDGTLFTEPEKFKEYAFVNKYGGELYSLFNLQESAEKISDHYKAPIYGMEILFGQDKEKVGDDLAIFGSFHGIFMPLLDTDRELGFVKQDAYETPGGQELTALFQGYLFDFISGEPTQGKEATEWKEWQKDSDEAILFLDADQKQATAVMSKKDFTYAEVLKQMEADDTIPADKKQTLITEVLNGRWFSYKLDKEYDNLSDFEKQRK